MYKSTWYNNYTPTTRLYKLDYLRILYVYNIINYIGSYYISKAYRRIIVIASYRSLLYNTMKSLLKYIKALTFTRDV